MKTSHKMKRRMVKGQEQTGGRKKSSEPCQVFAATGNTE
jgi:hypothetical protein